MSRQTIVWIAHEGNLSGANIALLEYVDALKEEYNFRVILPHKGNMGNALDQRKVGYSVIHQYGWANKPAWWQWPRIMIRSVIAIAQTKKIIREEKAAMLFTNTSIPFVGAIAARQLQIPHVWWLHEFGWEDFRFKIGWGNEQWAHSKMEQWSGLIIGNSEAVKNKFMALMPAAEIKRIYQPVSYDAKPSAVRKIKARFLMFGQIISTKGHLEVLSAIIKMKGEYTCDLPLLHIKGPCEDKKYLNELLQLIGRHHLQDKVVIEAGFFRKEDVMPFYEALIVASRSEAFGRVIVEANKAGLWAAVKNSGGAPELVNETNGLLYNSIDELAAILSGTKPFLSNRIRQNYDEQTELNKLKYLLKAL